MKRKVRCPKCRTTYWAGEPHSCASVAPPRKSVGENADSFDTAVEMGCCLLELLSCLPWLLAVLAATVVSVTLLIR